MIRIVLLLVVLVLTAAFAALNWAAFTAPTALWLGLTTVQAPVGVVMLAILAIVSLGFVAWIAWLQGTVLLESRRLNREVQAQRDLADRAEASRFTELQTTMMTRFNELEQRQRVALEEQGNSLAASIASMEDRLLRRDLPIDPRL